MPSQPRPPKSTNPPVTRYQIRDATGLLIAVHCRRDQADGDKQLWWEQPDGTKGLAGQPLAELPLYGIDRLGAESAVVLCEGEKAADALAGVGIQAVGTVTGAASCPGWAALAELTGRQIVLWPDNDQPGREHMRRIAEGLAGIVSGVRSVAWAEAPEHGDAADFLAGGKAAADVLALLDTAAVVPEASESDGSPGDTDAEPGRGRRPTELNRILALADGAELFHTPTGEVFADVMVDGHRETYAVAAGGGFADWIAARYWQAHHGGPREATLKDAVRALVARGRHEGLTRRVYLRIGEGDDGVLYQDLGDASWRAIRIDCDGWSIVDKPDVRFWRGSTMLPLPEPVPGGSLDELRPFVNCDSEEDWRLVLAWALFAHRARGPYPPLALGGQQDAGKTTTAKVLRRLIDPDAAAVTTLPHDEEDLMVVARDTWCPVFDNLWGLDAAQSDALCRLADGGSYKRRARYTDTSVASVSAQRPLILTGIGALATRGDLVSRALVLELPPLADGCAAGGVRLLARVRGGGSAHPRRTSRPHQRRAPRAAGSRTPGAAPDG